MVVISRGLVTNNANLWPLLHLSVLVPIILSVWFLRSGNIAKKTIANKGIA